MTGHPVGRRRSLARLLVASMLFGAPAAARAAQEVVAVRGLPSSISAEYGAPVLLGDPSVPGPFLVPTRTGIEIRDAASLSQAPAGIFRTAGQIGAAAVAGNTAFLFAGERGIILVDVTNPSGPAAIGSRGDLGAVTLGAASTDGYGVAAANAEELHFLGRTAPGELTRLASLRFADGRVVQAIRARSDSFLVASERLVPTPRLFLTLYRLPAGATEPESLREIQVPLETAYDVAWRGDIAFAADGNDGVVVANLRTGATRVAAFPGNRFVRALDVNDSLVVLALEGGLGKLRRFGVEGDSLANATFEGLELEPTHVTLSGSRVLLPALDAIAPQEPDEAGQSAILVRDLDAILSAAPLGGTGRTRRVQWDSGLAYVADYTGGLRVYRAAGSDTSLVGMLPPTPGARVVDLALDLVSRRAYLASGSVGLQIVDITDPGNPVLLSTLPLQNLVSAVAVADPNLIVVGRRGSVSGITLVDVTIPTAPTVRGSIGSGFILDPRAIAIRGTIAYVADSQLGLLSVDFSNPDAPQVIGPVSGASARDVALAGNLLFVGTRTRGLQIADIVNPAAPVLRSEVAAPPIFGVAAGSGSSAGSVILLLGNEEALVVDASDPFQPIVRGPIPVPGFARDAAWVSDTLLVASALALDRFYVSPSSVSVPPLQVEIEPGQILPVARIRWAPVLTPGIAGLNLYRDEIPSIPGTSNPVGARVNASLLPPGSVEAVDRGLEAGVTYRYRLEAFFPDGSSVQVAEGAASVPATPALGQPYPNPYRPGNGVVTVPFRASAGAGGAAMELRVFDARGRLVRRESFAAPATGGFGSAIWDGRDRNGRRVAEGVYFVQIQGGGIDDARRVVLLR
jgi:hypothetical protein